MVLCTSLLRINFLWANFSLILLKWTSHPGNCSFGIFLANKFFTNRGKCIRDSSGINSRNFRGKEDSLLFCLQPYCVLYLPRLFGSLTWLNCLTLYGLLLFDEGPVWKGFLAGGGMLRSSLKTTSTTCVWSVLTQQHTIWTFC